MPDLAPVYSGTSSEGQTEFQNHSTISILQMGKRKVSHIHTGSICSVWEQWHYISKAFLACM